MFVSGFIALFACQDCRYLKLGLEEISMRLMDGKLRAPLSRSANKSKWLRKRTEGKNRLGTWQCDRIRDSAKAKD